MGTDRWELVLLNVLCFMLCVQYLTYLIHILWPLARAKEPDFSEASLFDWHIVVPCLNEARVIGGTLDDLAMTFPLATIWVVDDASDDETVEIVERACEQYPNVRLLRRYLPEARTGKGAALNTAYRAIEETVPPGAARHQVMVGVVDADARLDPYSLDILSGEKYFGDPSVGAVQIQVRVTMDVEAFTTRDPAILLDDRRGQKADPLMVRMQDLEFTSTIAAMQMLRQRTGSVGMGGNGQFTRLSALDLVAEEFDTPWHGALLEDFELGLHVLLAGFRNEYCHEAFVVQEGLNKIKPLIRQRSRWAQGSMQCMRYLPRVLATTTVPLRAALEITYYLAVPWLQIIGSVAFPMALAVTVYYGLGATEGTDAWLLAGAWAIVPLSFLFGVMPYWIWGVIYRRQTGFLISWRHAAMLGTCHVFYGYLLQAAAWWALFRLVRGRVDWKKTERLQLGHRLHEVTGGAR